MQESVSMHKKSHTPIRHSRMNQARSGEEEKKRGRETVKIEARRLMERKAGQQNKNLSEEQNKAYTECDPLPPITFLYIQMNIFSH